MAKARPGSLLLALILAYVLAFVDRQIPVLLVEPMKVDLGLSDVAVSVLYGLSFAGMASLVGVPVGMLVDRRPRLVLIAPRWVKPTGGGILGYQRCRMLLGGAPVTRR